MTNQNAAQYFENTTQTKEKVYGFRSEFSDVYIVSLQNSNSQDSRNHEAAYR